jgi:NitT/TauT family transport system permease protein
MQRTLGMFAGRLLVLALLLLAWQFAAGRLLPVFTISRPTIVAAQIWDWFQSGFIWPHIFATIQAMLSGYVIGAACGIAAGLILGFHPALLAVLQPYLTALYALPKIALAPLLVITLGIDLSSKIALVAITVFFLVLYGTLDGIRDVDRDIVEALRLMGASASEISRKVLIPASLPWIFTSLRIAVRYALTATILGELIAANRGLGFLVQSNAGSFDAAGVFAAVFVLVCISVAMTEGLTSIENIYARKVPSINSDA